MTDSERTAEDFRAFADEQYNNGNFAEAIEYYKKCVELEPELAFIYNRISHVYGQIDEYKYLDEQIKYSRKALALNPNYANAIRNLAFAYSRLGKNEQAVECFRKVIDLEAVPDDYCAYGCLKIKLGEFKEGWELYKYRFFKRFGATFYPQIKEPEWNGENIHDKTLLVQFEQGYGDTIQFFRYLEQVKPLVGKIIFRVQDQLFDLLKNNTEDIEIVKDSEPLNPDNFDYHIPLLNLMCVLDTRIDNIPLSDGYIKADSDKIKEYKDKYFNNDFIKIGICYNGAQFGNKRRDVPLELFYPLTKLKNVKVYSFQKGPITTALKKLPADVEITDLGKTFRDFSDTAAAMTNMDLFITSDNSMLNLAGAMGKKTFALLSKDAEWRWFFDEETTPWYKSIRFFKKHDECEDWSIQMQRVINEIENLLDY